MCVWLIHTRCIMCQERECYEVESRDGVKRHCAKEKAAPSLSA